MPDHKYYIKHIDGNNGRCEKPINNSPRNLVILCRKCHSKIHNRWYTIGVGIQ
jgi:5-methylcytosine-specific restriction endonuclease McrA